MLRRERRSRRGRVRLPHVLVRDVAYGQIPLLPQRAEKHRRAAEWIESLSVDRENAPGMVAHDYSQALEYARDAGQATDELERLTRFALRHAAERAAALNSFASAQRHYDAAARPVAEDDPHPPLLVVVTSDVGDPLADRMSELLGRATKRLTAACYANAARAEMLVAFRHEPGPDAAGRRRLCPLGRSRRPCRAVADGRTRDEPACHQLDAAGRVPGDARPV